MSRTIYYIGAGASRGKRDDKGNILEGVPVVSEIPNEFAAFREFINNAVVPDGYTTFLGLYHTSANDVQGIRGTGTFIHSLYTNKHNIFPQELLSKCSLS